MKKYISKNQLLFICIYFTLFYLCTGYFYDNFLKEKGFYEFIKNYFGVISIVILIIIAVKSFLLLMVDKRKKMIFSIRTNFFILLLCSFMVLYFAIKIDLPYQKIVASEKQLKELVEIGLYQYEIGLFFTFILAMLYTKVAGMYIYIFASFFIILSLFFLLAKFIRVTISKIIWNIKEKRRLKKEKLLIQEQIRIKEYYEKLAREEALKEKKKQELIEEIQRERLEMEKIGTESIEEQEKNIEKQETTILDETIESSDDKIILEEKVELEEKTQVDSIAEQMTESTILTENKTDNNIEKIEEEDTNIEEIGIVLENNKSEEEKEELKGENFN